MSTSLPEGLLEKILLKVPIKPLLRFLTVSKEWQKVISRLQPLKNPTLFFICRSLVSQEHVLCHEKDGTLQEYARHEAHRNSNFQSCGNGLICFSDDEKDVSLWNPWIRRVFNVPKSGLESQKGGMFSFGVVVDHIRNEYMILRIDNNESEISMEIFRVSTNSWEVVDMEIRFYQMGEYQVDLKGKSYWIAVDLEFDPILVSFEGHGEVFRAVKMHVPAPFRTFWTRCDKMLFLFEESLVFVHSAHDEDNSGEEVDEKKGQFLDNEKFKTKSLIFVCVDAENSWNEKGVVQKGPFMYTYKVWKMEADNDGESWRLWCHILFDQPVKALGFRENGELVFAGGWVTTKLISINLDEDTYGRLGICNAYIINSCQNYVESVALLDPARNDAEPPSP